MSDIITKVPTITRNAYVDYIIFMGCLCHVRLRKLQHICCVLFLDERIGRSVTNAAENLVQSTYREHLREYSQEYCIFAETYPDFDRRIDIIIPVWEDDEVLKVTWKTLGTVENDLVYE